MIKVKVRLLDEKKNICLDSAMRAHFSIPGQSQLIDNEGTSTGSRVAELKNGFAEISVRINNGKSV